MENEARSRRKFVVRAKSLTWSSWGRGGIGLWRWRAAGWMLEGCVDWRDNLKFKARAASVVRSLTECHDGCCGRSCRSCYKAGQFLSFSRGIVSRSLLGCCTREFDSSRRHKLGRESHRPRFSAIFSASPTLFLLLSLSLSLSLCCQTLEKNRGITLSINPLE